MAENDTRDNVFDSSLQHLGGVYAKALFGVVEKAGNTDEVVEINIPPELVGMYVHGASGDMIARIAWRSPEFSGTPFNWAIALDQAVWVLR